MHKRLSRFDRFDDQPAAAPQLEEHFPVSIRDHSICATMESHSTHIQALLAMGQQQVDL